MKENQEKDRSKTQSASGFEPKLINFKSVKNLEEIMNDDLRESSENLIREIFLATDSAESGSIDEGIKLLCDLATQVQSTSQALISAGHLLAASHLLGEFVEAQPWLEADYGSADGFWVEHTQNAILLYELGKKLPKDLIPDEFISSKSYFTLNIGIALNKNLSLDDVQNLAKSAELYEQMSEEEDPLILAALMLNKSVDNETAKSFISEFDEIQAASICALITGIFRVWGCSTESVQLCAHEEHFSDDSLRFIYENSCNSKTNFNGDVLWQQLQVDCTEVKNAIKTRLDL